MIKKITIGTLKLFDFFYQKKIINFLKKNYNIKKIIDVGSHEGETIELFLKHFNVNEIISFEASKKNFLKSMIRVNKLKRYHNIKIIINNIALGEKISKRRFNQLIDSSSSTFSKINTESKYFKKKFFFLGLKKTNKFIDESSIMQIVTLDSYFKDKDFLNFDLIKIDTEGYELNVLKGFIKNIHKIKNILFEHHYDNMVNKEYKFSDINNFLVKNNFKMVFKCKMPFRKTFEYIYHNKNYLNTL